MLLRQPRQGIRSRGRRGSRRTKAETKFVADAMLGSLARKLRAFGFDTVYYKDGSDSDLLDLAASEGRVILSSDRSLSERAEARRMTSLVITGSKESQRLVSLRTGAEASGLLLGRGPPRCSLCNGDLLKTPKSDLVGSIPARVLRRHRLFYRCLDCGMIYWRGSHWKKLRWLEKLLDPGPDAVDSRRRQGGGRPGEAVARSSRQRGIHATHTKNFRRICRA